MRHDSCLRLRVPLARGFSLIELMIAVALVAILAAVAFPSFMDSVRKSRRSEAFAALSNVQQAQERFRANNTSYAANLSAAPTDTPPGLGLGATTPNGYYTIALVAATATSYEATATAVAGTSQAHDGSCTTLGVKMVNATLEYAGSSGALTYAASNRCWSR